MKVSNLKYLRTIIDDKNEKREISEYRLGTKQQQDRQTCAAETMYLTGKDEERLGPNINRRRRIPNADYLRNKINTTRRRHSEGNEGTKKTLVWIYQQKRK